MVVSFLRTPSCYLNLLFSSSFDPLIFPVLLNFDATIIFNFVSIQCRTLCWQRSLAASFQELFGAKLFYPVFTMNTLYLVDTGLGKPPPTSFQLLLLIQSTTLSSKQLRLFWRSPAFKFYETPYSTLSAYFCTNSNTREVLQLLVVCSSLLLFLDA